MDEREIKTALEQSFFKGETWPVDLAALTALIDLGKPLQDIANHFGISQLDVLALCESYKISPPTTRK